VRTKKSKLNGREGEDLRSVRSTLGQNTKARNTQKHTFIYSSLSVPTININKTASVIIIINNNNDDDYYYNIIITRQCQSVTVLVCHSTSIVGTFIEHRLSA
jgi:hypothetical protein